MSCCTNVTPCQAGTKAATVVQGRPQCVMPHEPSLAIQFAGGCMGRYPDVPPEDVRLHIERVGDPTWWVDYMGMRQDADHNIVFQFDEAYFEMPPGRYFGQVWAGECCALIQLELPDCGPLTFIGCENKVDPDQPCDDPDAPEDCPDA